MNKQKSVFNIFFAVFFISFFCICTGCNIKPKERYIETSYIQLSKNISVGQDEEKTLAAVVMPENSTDKKIEWFSENINIASVNQKGVVKGINRGKTVITAKAGGKTAKCEVMVVRNGFVFVYTPDKYIEGKESNNTYSDSNSPKEYYEGVFVKGRNVKITPYAIAKYEVTYEFWKTIYEWAIKHGYKFANDGGKSSASIQSGNNPVTIINWHDCIVWCNAYTEKLYKSDEECVYRRSRTDNSVLKDATITKEKSYIFICDYAYADTSKKGFRLPTEAEWEFAARYHGEECTGKNTEQYGAVYLTNLDSGSGAEGNSEYDIGEVAWYEDNSDGVTHDVGLKKENALGLYDMSGNIAEWCFDWYADDVKKSDQAYTVDGVITDPQGYIPPESNLDNEHRVVRGGHYEAPSPPHCLTGTRTGFAPFYPLKGYGLRLVYRP